MLFRSDFVLKQESEGYYSYKTLNSPVFETVKKINDNLLGIDKIVYGYDDIFNVRTNEIKDIDNVYNKKRIY